MDQHSGDRSGGPRDHQDHPAATPYDAFEGASGLGPDDTDVFGGPAPEPAGEAGTPAPAEFSAFDGPATFPEPGTYTEPSAYVGPTPYADRSPYPVPPALPEPPAFPEPGTYPDLAASSEHVARPELPAVPVTPAAAEPATRSDGIGRFEAAESFDAFAAGANRPPGAQAPVPAPVHVGEPPEPATSLFDSTKPLPKTTRPTRDPITAEIGTPNGGNTRIHRVVTADYVLTVNPVDGTEVTLCPPEERPVPVRRTRDERTDRLNDSRPTPPPGPAAVEPPLLERDEERERLIRLLARGRSVRVTGPSGSGRSSLLESVAAACADLAPDGVLWLSGYRRTAADVLQDLYAVVYAGDGYRPGRAELPGLLSDVGAVIVIDDLEFGGTALEELLDAAPECAFLMSATPDVPAPAADSTIEEVFLAGLTRVACVDLLQYVAGRRLEEDETAWAADLWFESEGLPLRFVQAGALLRQRDALRGPSEPDLDDSVWQNGTRPQAAAEAAIPGLAAFDDLPPALTEGAGATGDGGADEHGNVVDVAGGERSTDPLTMPLKAVGALDLVRSLDPPNPLLPLSPVNPLSADNPVLGMSAPPQPVPTGPATDVPLPSLAESAAPAALLASRLSESAREALAFAVALDGECPNPSHLPALVGDTHGDAALGELTSVGLAVPVSSHFRLAAGVVKQLRPALSLDGDLTDVQAHTAAMHYAWWTGHPSVSPERAAAESEAILAAMTACRDGGHATAAVLLARTVAPVFAAALHWGAWERALRIGQEAARLSGEVAEEAYFHHELGVLALCMGNTDRARAELEASIALRAALADRQGTVVGRRTLALVNDRSGAALELLPGAGEFAPGLTDSARAVSGAVVISKGPGRHASGGAGGTNGGAGVRRLAVVGSRRNLVAAGTGVLLAAVLGTIVTLGATAGGGDSPTQVKPIESVEQDAPTDTTAAEDGTTAVPPVSATSPTTSPSASTTDTAAGGAQTAPGTQTTAPAGGTVSTPPPSTTTAPGGGTTGGGGTTPSPSHSPSTKPTPTPTTTPPTTPPTTPTDTGSPTPTDTTPASQSASVPAPSTAPDTPSASISTGTSTETASATTTG